MIILTSGFPYAGKTTFVKQLMSSLGISNNDEIDDEKCAYISYKQCLPSNFNGFSKSTQQEIAGLAYEISLELLQEEVEKNGNNHIIIYDSCCGVINKLIPILYLAKNRKHTIITIYIDTDKHIRFKRHNNETIKKLEKKYSNNFKTSIPTLKSLSNYFYIVRHNKFKKYIKIIKDNILRLEER